ncbi:Zn-dependent alcohol dehydrogenase [Streptomyces mangrovisoli]|uniref:Zn-dependent alcohol dehydrogenase n=1 Tax=Streptomyces mangrovisoli TaxID=1428628 RepID=A0A1J4P0J1_9ACTN|nr:Zn-dependent alcohol dehydrogenase [Streptomyces mangrovisoli]OIJ68263.1 Zn-dependent alcohol dehydrogenase [Streptomyces mangrovisoli]
MLAALITAPGQDKLEIRDAVEATGFGPGKVRVAIKATGLCHSDLSGMSGKIPGPAPLVLGHEGAGQVLEVGDGVTHVRPGDRVIVNWRPACGRCPHCRIGESNLCDSGSQAMRVPAFTSRGTDLYRFMGAGTFAEEVVLDAGFAVPLPDDVSYEAAALIGCGVTTGIGAAINSSGVKPGENVAVIGCGGVGISAVMGAKAAGAAQIVAVDPVARRRDWARDFGATTAVAPDELAGAVADLTGGLGFDHVIEAVGRPGTVRSAYEAARRGGTMCLVGVGGFEDMLPVNLLELFVSAKRIVPSVYGGDDVTRTYDRIIGLLRAGRIDLEALVTHRLPLAQVNDALDLMRTGEALRVMLTND